MSRHQQQLKTIGKNVRTPFRERCGSSDMRTQLTHRGPFGVDFEWNRLHTGPLGPCGRIGMAAQAPHGRDWYGNRRHGAGLEWKQAPRGPLGPPGQDWNGGTGHRAPPFPGLSEPDIRFFLSGKSHIQKKRSNSAKQIRFRGGIPPGEIRAKILRRLVLISRKTVGWRPNW